MPDKEGANKPVGVFDSGIGGLTVVKQLIQLIPAEDIVYFGDLARLPYGTKSNKLIRQYALEDAAFLEQFDIKKLIIGCNSASAAALDLLKSTRTIPVTGVIEPGVMAALHATKNNRIGIIGTTATIASQAYDKKIIEMDTTAFVFGQPCPLLVSLVEEGWIEDEITRLTIDKYLEPLVKKNVDTIILGCTHFPVIKHVIQEQIGPDITLIDSAEETAHEVSRQLNEMRIAKESGNKGYFKCFVSDIPGRFDEIGTRFLGRPVVNATRVDFDKFLIEQGNELYQPLNL